MNPIQEPKYDVDQNGHLYNRETGIEIPEDEPIFILRARDIFAIDALRKYAAFAGAFVPLHMLSDAEKEHRRCVLARVNQFREFSRKHPERMKKPDTQLSLPFLEIEKDL